MLVKLLFVSYCLKGLMFLIQTRKPNQTITVSRWRFKVPQLVINTRLSYTDADVVFVSPGYDRFIILKAERGNDFFFLVVKPFSDQCLDGFCSICHKEMECILPRILFWIHAPVFRSKCFYISNHLERNISAASSFMT